MTTKATRRLTRYAVAVLCVLAATGARLALAPLFSDRLPLIVFYPAVMVAAWFGGFGPGMIATLGAAVAHADPDRSRSDQRSRDPPWCNGCGPTKLTDCGVIP